MEVIHFRTNCNFCALSQFQLPTQRALGFICCLLSSSGTRSALATYKPKISHNLIMLPPENICGTAFDLVFYLFHSCLFFFLWPVCYFYGFPHLLCQRYQSRALLRQLSAMCLDLRVPLYASGESNAPQNGS